MTVQTNLPIEQAAQTQRDVFADQYATLKMHLASMVTPAPGQDIDPLITEKLIEELIAYATQFLSILDPLVLFHVTQLKTARYHNIYEMVAKAKCDIRDYARNIAVNDAYAERCQREADSVITHRQNVERLHLRTTEANLAIALALNRIADAMQVRDETTKVEGPSNGIDDLPIWTGPLYSDEETHAQERAANGLPPEEVEVAEPFKDHGYLYSRKVEWTAYRVRLGDATTIHGTARVEPTREYLMASGNKALLAAIDKTQQTVDRGVLSSYFVTVRALDDGPFIDRLLIPTK